MLQTSTLETTAVSSTDKKKKKVGTSEQCQEEEIVTLTTSKNIAKDSPNQVQHVLPLGHLQLMWEL